MRQFEPIGEDEKIVDLRLFVTAALVVAAVIVVVVGLSWVVGTIMHIGSPR